MNKLSTALAVGLLAASSALFAQTAVTLGGQIKLGMDHISLNSRSAERSAARLTNNTSFWYLDGKEDLGGGKSAYYRLEWDFAADTGAFGAGRNFFVGLGDARLGRLQLGRQSVYFSHHWFQGDYHGAFDAAPNAANSLNVLGTVNGAYFAGGFLNNTIRYQAPSIGGFSGMASYTFDAESAETRRNKTWYISPTYTKGPLRVGYYHLSRRSQGSMPGQTVGSLDQDADRFAFSYLQSGFRFGLLVDRNKVTDRASGTSQHRWAYAIPLTYGMGPHLLSATWGQALSTRINGSKLASSGAKMLSLSYQYSLSKRTALDLSVIELRNQKNGRYNFWNGGMGGLQLAASDAGGKSRMIYAGMKHTF